MPPADRLPPDREARRAELQAWVDRAQGFEGWSFPLGETDVGDPRPWDYADVVAQHAPAATRVLDIGTGGGERLEAMLPTLPPAVVALEQWPVNAPVARARLHPHGVHVVHAASEPSHLPFQEEAFDLVIARHDNPEPDDVWRVLAPGGILVAQMAYAPGSWRELHRHLPMTNWSLVIPVMVDGMRAAGFELLRYEEHLARTRYPSLGALVYLLQVTHTWECPTFSLDEHLDALLALEEAYGDPDGGVTISEGRTLIVARKPV